MIQQKILPIDRRVSPDHVTNGLFNHVITAKLLESVLGLKRPLLLNYSSWKRPGSY